MNTFLNLAQVLLACAMVDVWVRRYSRPGLVRGGDARSMAEEFRHYGLPDWFRNLMRIAKLSAGALLLLGIWLPWAAVMGGSVLGVLLAGAVAMHLKVNDPVYKLLPSFAFMLLSLVVAYFRWQQLNLPD